MCSPPLSLSGKEKNKQSGFTLVELMVVMAIIAILATAGLSAYTNYIDKARITKVGEFARNVNTGLADKLILKLDFDEGTMADTSGYNHNGTCSGAACPVAAVGHNGGGAYQFDGVNDIITLGKGDDFFPMPTFTICAWIKTPGCAPLMTSNGIISVTYGLVLEIATSGWPHSYLNNSSSTNMQYATIASNLNNNKFHHVCVAYDGTQRHLYIDGVDKYRDTVPWTGTTYWPTMSVVIGANINNSNVSRFNGIIDDVRMYSSGLLAGDIEKMYRDGTSKYLALR